MNFHRARVEGVLVGGIMLALGACTPKTEQAPIAPAAKPVTAVVAPTNLDAVSAVLVGTKTLPGKLSFVVDETPQIGTVGRAHLKFEADAALNSLSLTATGTALLNISEESAKYVFPAMQAGQSVEHSVVFTGLAAGLANIDLAFNAESESGVVNANYAVPVMIDPKVAKP
jgi:hypothetical protein